MFPKGVQRWGETADGFPVFRIKSKEYFLKNGKLFIIGKETEEHTSIKALFYGIIAKEVVKSKPDLLKKGDGITDKNEIENLVRESLKRFYRIENAIKKLIIVIRAKICAMIWLKKTVVKIAVQKLLNLKKKRTSVDTSNNTIRHFDTNQPLYPLNPVYDLTRTTTHPFDMLKRN